MNVKHTIEAILAAKMPDPSIPSRKAGLSAEERKTYQPGPRQVFRNGKLVVVRQVAKPTLRKKVGKPVLDTGVCSDWYIKLRDRRASFVTAAVKLAGKMAREKGVSLTPQEFGMVRLAAHREFTCIKQAELVQRMKGRGIVLRSAVKLKPAKSSPARVKEVVAAKRVRSTKQIWWDESFSGRDLPQARVPRLQAAKAKAKAAVYEEIETTKKVKDQIESELEEYAFSDYASEFETIRASVKAGFEEAQAYIEAKELKVTAEELADWAMDCSALIAKQNMLKEQLAKLEEQAIEIEGKVILTPDEIKANIIADKAAAIAEAKARNKAKAEARLAKAKAKQDAEEPKAPKQKGTKEENNKRIYASVKHLLAEAEKRKAAKNASQTEKNKNKQKKAK